MKINLKKHGIIILMSLLPFFVLAVPVAGVSPDSNAPKSLGTFINGKLQSNNTEFLNLKNKATLVLTKSAVSNISKSVSTLGLPMMLEKDDIARISAPRNSWLTFLDNDINISMDIGIEDASNAQNWILPNNILDIFQSYYNEDFIPTEEVPLDLQFPAANKVVKSTYLDVANNEIDLFEHYFIGDDALNFLGNSYYYYLDGGEDAFDAVDYKFTDIPLALGDTYSYIEDEVSQPFIGLRYYNRTKTVDAFGTIETPYGTFECLRINFITDLYSRPDISSSYTFNKSYKSVAFVTKSGHYISANVSGKAGNVTLSEIEFRVIAPTGILSPVETVQINNDGDGVLISNTGVYIDVLTKTADPDAILDIESDDKGIMIPRLEEYNRPLDPNEGLLIYQIDNDPGFYYYDGYDWTRLDNTTPTPSARKAATNSQEITKLAKRGLGALINGYAKVEIGELGNLSADEFLINLQPEGNCNGLYISKKTPTYFEVKELNNGTANVKFGWNLNEI